MTGLPPASAQRLAPAPGDHPDELHGGRREEVLEVRACQAKGPTPAQIEASRALRETALHSCPQGRLGGELRRLLAVPRGLECLVVRLQPDGEVAWSASWGGARLAGKAPTTRGAIDPEAPHGVARDLMARSPMDAGLSLGTARLLGLSLDDTGLEVVASPFPPLPTVGAKRRPNHLERMRGLGRDQQVRIDSPAVEPVAAWEEMTMGEVLLDSRAHDAILRGRWRRHPWCHELGGVGLTGLRAVDLRTDPMRLALTTVAGLQVVGRGAPLRAVARRSCATGGLRAPGPDRGHRVAPRAAGVPRGRGVP